jgi:hypothetical protein
MKNFKPKLADSFLDSKNKIECIGMAEQQMTHAMIVCACVCVCVCLCVCERAREREIKYYMNSPQKKFKTIMQKVNLIGG